MSRTTIRLTPAGHDLAHLKRFLVAMARARCQPPAGTQDEALPEFKKRWTNNERITQLAFAKECGFSNGSSVSSHFRDVNNLGDTWTGYVDALGFPTIEKAIAAARQWKEPPERPEVVHTEAMLLGAKEYEKVEGHRVTRRMLAAALTLFAETGQDLPYYEWMVVFQKLDPRKNRVRAKSQAVLAEVQEPQIPVGNSSATNARRGRHPRRP